MRTAIKDFALANRLYAGATVTFYTVSGGAKTATKATLYAAPTGSATLGNPQVLGSDGKLKRAVYIEVPTIATVTGLTVATHDTGVINPAPSFRINSTTSLLEYSFDGGSTWTSSGSTLFKSRGAWVTATAYNVTDTFSNSGTLYYVATAHTSAASLATDVAAGRVVAFSSLSLPLSLANGGTGATSAAGARTALSLGTAALVDTGTTSGKVPTLNADGKLPTSVGDPDFLQVFASANAGALTITVPSGEFLEFNDNGVRQQVLLTSALTLTVASGGTLGLSSGTNGRLWVAAVYNGGTPELAVINTWNGTDVYEILPTDMIATTAVGAGSTSAHTWYSTTSRSSQAIVIIGYLEAVNTAGAWASPSLAIGYGPGVPLPGQVVQTRRKSLRTGVNAGATVLPFDNTIPQNTEGNSVSALDTTITPHSALNIGRVRASVFMSNSGTNYVQVALFQDAATDAFAVNGTYSPTATVQVDVSAPSTPLGTASPTTFKVRAGGSSATNTYINQDNTGAQLYNGKANTFLEVQEIMR